MKRLKSAPHSHPVRRVALGALFLAFLKVSLCGFGGGLFWAPAVLVALAPLSIAATVLEGARPQ